MTTQPEQVTTTVLAKQEPQERMIAPQSLTPAQMLSIAVQQDAPVEKIEKLMDLQQRWEANEARKAFEAAMVAFSSRVPTIAKTRKGHNSKYAGLPETVEEIQDLMAECQLSRRWEDRDPKKPGNIRIRVVVSHVMGHSVSFELEAGPDIGAGRNDIQAVASTITYLRRITLFGALGLVAGDEVDDDGAGGKKTEPPQPRSATLTNKDPAEKKAKTDFWNAAQKKAGAKLSADQARALFARVQEASGKQTAAECLAYIGREDVQISEDGIVSQIVDDIQDAQFNEIPPAVLDQEPPSADDLPYQCDECMQKFKVKPANHKDTKGERCLGNVTKGESQ